MKLIVTLAVVIAALLVFNFPTAWVIMQLEALLSQNVSWPSKTWSYWGAYSVGLVITYLELCFSDRSKQALEDALRGAK